MNPPDPSVPEGPLEEGDPGDIDLGFTESTKPIPTRVVSTAPHFRIVYPRRLIGTKHLGASGRIYVTWPGETEEFRLPNVRAIQPHYPLDAVVELDLTIVGSVEVQYVDMDEETP